mmetsp:Transcript_76536/g.169113  ORF Transcript_76536/g.169113 Transcript_76536/m.169113 type:complete len:223 (-) Transcript_76536:783-1451(-)
MAPLNTPFGIPNCPVMPKATTWHSWLAMPKHCPPCVRSSTVRSLVWLPRLALSWVLKQQGKEQLWSYRCPRCGPISSAPGAPSGASSGASTCGGQGRRRSVPWVEADGRRPHGSCWRKRMILSLLLVFRRPRGANSRTFALRSCSNWLRCPRPGCHHLQNPLGYNWRQCRGSGCRQGFSTNQRAARYQLPNCWRMQSRSCSTCHMTTRVTYFWIWKALLRPD